MRVLAPGNVHLVLRRLWVTAVCAALGACAPAPVSPEAITAPPEPGRAVVIGWGNTAAENARAAFRAEWDTRVTRLYVGWINLRKVSLGENIVRLEPGDQELIVSCGIYVDHRFFTYDEALRAHLEANRVYRLRANPEGRRCQPYIEDVTGKEG